MCGCVHAAVCSRVFMLPACCQRSPEPPPHLFSQPYPPPPVAVHTAEEALSWCSITILSVFVAELFARLLVFGTSYFTSSW